MSTPCHGKYTIRVLTFLWARTASTLEESEMPDDFTSGDARDLLSSATSEAVTVARFSQWLATAGRDSLKEAEQDAQSLRRLNGLVEALIILSKLTRRMLGDEAEQGYPQDQLLHRLFENGAEYGCRSEILWAAQRATRSAPIGPS